MKENWAARRSTTPVQLPALHMMYYCQVSFQNVLKSILIPYVLTIFHWSVTQTLSFLSFPLLSDTHQDIKKKKKRWKWIQIKMKIFLEGYIKIKIKKHTIIIYNFLLRKPPRMRRNQLLDVATLKKWSSVKVIETINVLIRNLLYSFILISKSWTEVSLR